MLWPRCSQMPAAVLRSCSARGGGGWKLRGEGWVPMPCGLLREPGQSQGGHYHPEGTVGWLLLSGELTNDINDIND